MAHKRTALLQEIYQVVATIAQGYFLNYKTRNYIIFSGEITHSISSHPLIAFKNTAKPQ